MRTYAPNVLETLLQKGKVIANELEAITAELIGKRQNPFCTRIYTDEMEWAPAGSGPDVNIPGGREEKDQDQQGRYESESETEEEEDTDDDDDETSWSKYIGSKIENT